MKTALACDTQWTRWTYRCHHLRSASAEHRTHSPEFPPSACDSVGRHHNRPAQTTHHACEEHARSRFAHSACTVKQVTQGAM